MLYRDVWESHFQMMLLIIQGLDMETKGKEVEIK